MYVEKLKEILSNSNYNLTTLNNEINKRNGTDTSVQNLSAKINRKNLRYEEVVQILDILGYEIEWKEKSRSNQQSPLSLDHYAPKYTTEYTPLLENLIEIHVHKALETKMKQILKNEIADEVAIAIEDIKRSE